MPHQGDDPGVVVGVHPGLVDPRRDVVGEGEERALRPEVVAEERRADAVVDELDEPHFVAEGTQPIGEGRPVGAVAGPPHERYEPGSP